MLYTLGMKKIAVGGLLVLALVIGAGIVLFQNKPPLTELVVDNPPDVPEEIIATSSEVETVVEPATVTSTTSPVETKPVSKPVLVIKTVVQPRVTPTPSVTRIDDESSALEVYYKNLVKYSGVAAAFVELKKNYETSPAVKAECHQITHAIGHAATDVVGSVGKAFTLGDPMCWSGYYHGVMEETLEAVGTTTLKTTINNICSDVPGKNAYSFDYYNCVHGLGHGIMLLYNYDLFASLDVCSTLDGAWEKSSCGGGVFMENIMIESRGGKSDFLKPEDPIYPCNAVPGAHKSQCYMMQTSHILTAVGGDFSKVFEICSTVEEDYRETCYQSLGRDASGRSVSNIESTVASCNLAPTASGLLNCVIGAVKDFISFHHSDIEAKQLCARFEPDVNRQCLAVTKDYYATF